MLVIQSWSAFEKAKELLQGEVIVVGDGYTDYQLFEAGLADKFIAYTEHVERASIMLSKKPSV